MLQTDKSDGKSSTLDSRDGSYLSTLHLARVMVIKSLISTGILIISLKAGERLWSVHVPTSWPTQRLAGLARAQGRGEGAEACFGEGLGQHLANHSPLPLAFSCEIGIISESYL